LPLSTDSSLAEISPPDLPPSSPSPKAARLSRTPLRAGVPAPALGRQTREILAEVGLGDRADAMIASGGVRDSMGMAMR